MQYGKQLGYTRKDITLFGMGVLAVGLGAYFGLQAIGGPAIRAASCVQIILVLGLCIAWVAYATVFPVANKVSVS